MKNYIERIQQWNEIAEVVPSEETSELYLKLIDEEFSEFLKALVEKNHVETLDGCVDTVWVIVGYMRARGWDVNGAFEEVDRSNYSKFIEKEDGTFQCIKREDGKILKPDSFSPVDLTPYIKKEER